MPFTERRIIRAGSNKCEAGAKVRMDEGCCYCRNE
jgi:hypothetical protein